MSILRNLRAFWNNVWRSKKRGWALLLLVLIVVIGVISAIILFTQPHKMGNTGSSDDGPQTVTNVCTEALNKKANGFIAATDQVGLSGVVDEIMALEGYDRDPNCLYIVLQYQLGGGDATASRKTLTQLKKFVDPTFRFSEEFTTGPITIESLQKNVDFLSENAGQQLDSQNIKDGSNEADRYYREHQQ